MECNSVSIYTQKDFFKFEQKLNEHILWFFSLKNLSLLLYNHSTKLCCGEYSHVAFSFIWLRFYRFLSHDEWKCFFNVVSLRVCTFFHFFSSREKFNYSINLNYCGSTWKYLVVLREFWKPFCFVNFASNICIEICIVFHVININNWNKLVCLFFSLLLYIQ